MFSGAGAGPLAWASSVTRHQRGDQDGPTYKLSVAGAANFTANVGIGGTVSLTGTPSDGSELTALLLNSSNQIVQRDLTANAFSTSTFLTANGTPVQYQMAYWNSASQLQGDNNFWFDGTNVGIGTTAVSAYRLNVAGNVNVSGTGATRPHQHLERQRPHRGNGNFEPQ
jgi:hypothetical protein